MVHLFHLWLFYGRSSPRIRDSGPQASGIPVHDGMGVIGPFQEIEKELCCFKGLVLVVSNLVKWTAGRNGTW